MNENQNQICKSLYEALLATPPRSAERRRAVTRYQEANAHRASLKRAERLTNQSHPH